MKVQTDADPFVINYQTLTSKTLLAMLPYAQNDPNRLNAITYLLSEVRIARRRVRRGVHVDIRL